jgi:beta-lactamase regulating signal transducer with metallopeptidase domain
MNRNTGAGLLGFGIVLVIVGAILEFAVTAQAKGFNVNTVGMILLIVGIVAFLLGLVFMISGGSRRTTITQDVRNTPDGGQQRVLEERDSMAP